MIISEKYWLTKQEIRPDSIIWAPNISKWIIPIKHVVEKAIQLINEPNIAC